MLPDIEQTGAKLAETIEEAVKDADVVIALRIQLERQQKALFPTIREYARLFGLNRDKLALARPDALLLHPGPVNRGEVRYRIFSHFQGPRGVFG
jgi:aspartate carbamoyltransferase catalytic subunit